MDNPNGDELLQVRPDYSPFRGRVCKTGPVGEKYIYFSFDYTMLFM